jgi:hypothetical protein
MHGELAKTVGTLLAPGLLVLALATGSARGDDTSILGRLFRMGGASSSSGSGSSSRSTSPFDRPAPLPYGASGGSGGTFIPPATTSSRAPSLTPAQGPIPEGPTTPDVASSADLQPRVTPQPRHSSAVTTADPLLTRLALGRSNDGSQFGMFLRIFADGTVIDSEGTHRLSPSDLKPIVASIQNAELARARGHCSSPSSDFVEYVHIVVFERRLGRLQAHSFSYSGNPQGCDHSVRHLHTVLEALQAKLSRNPVTTTPVATVGNSAVVPPSSNLLPGAAASPVPHSSISGNNSSTPSIPGSHSISPLPDPGTTSAIGPVIPLTPLEPR